MSAMHLSLIWEHNGEDTLLYCGDLPGAFARGACLDLAVAKMRGEASSYMKWAGVYQPEDIAFDIAQEKESDLCIRDADSDVIFDSERAPLSEDEYARLKALAMKSADCFQALYESIPKKDVGDIAVRNTFYGGLPRTAREMYEHTRSVNSYYFGEIGVDADCDGSIAECRARGFAALEGIPGYLQNPVIDGSYGEEWSLRKVLRRFIWHDRIHARAMYRMAKRLFPHASIDGGFCFE